MTGAWNDYNDAESQNSYDLIPKGTMVPVRMTLKPGGYDDPSQGWTGGYATRNETTGSVYLNAEFVVLEGAHARRKIWSLIGLLSLKGPEWGNMGRSFVRGILNSARGLSDKDNSPQAQTARRINGFADLDGIEFLAKIDVGKDANGDVTPLTDFVMSEIDLLKRSSFRWCDLFGDDAALVANGFSAWGGIFFLHGRWHAVGGAKGQRSRLLAVGERNICLAAADDWLNENETDESAHKTRSWLNQPATERQLKYLPPQFRQNFGLTRYQASALLTFQFNKGAITSLVASATDVRRAA